MYNGHSPWYICITLKNGETLEYYPSHEPLFKDTDKQVSLMWEKSSGRVLKLEILLDNIAAFEFIVPTELQEDDVRALLAEQKQEAHNFMERSKRGLDSMGHR